jgi:hypothetical protein
MLVLLLLFRPYLFDRTFWIDVACYLCLIAQFGLQIIAADREFLGVAVSLNHGRFFEALLSSSTVLRRVSLRCVVCRPLLIFMTICPHSFTQSIQIFACGCVRCCLVEDQDEFR